MASNTAGEDAAFDVAIQKLADPPRPVPFSLRFHLRFGGKVSLVGWLFSLVSVLLVLALIDPVALWREMQLGESARVAPGVAVGWRETNMLINDVPVVENHVRFECRKGPCECTSFADGIGLEADAPVTVLFLPETPEVCQVVGMRATKAGLTGAFIVGIFLFIGLTILAVPAVLASGRLHLLRVGRYTRGVLVNREATNMRVNDARVWKLTFRFVDDLGVEHTRAFKTSLIEDVTDDGREGILYDPAKPERFVLVDLLPGAVTLSPEGAWQAVDGRRRVMGLIGPVSFALVTSLVWILV